MNCPTCGLPMAVNGRFWICGRHASPTFLPVGDEVAGAAEGEWLADVANAYPFPIACAYRRLRDDLLSHRDDHDALRQLILVKDCVETLVKYLALVTLAARLDRGERDDALDRRLLEALVAPALGTWAQMVLKPLVDADTTRADGRLAPLVAFASKEFFGAVAKFTSLRNAVLGHGLARAPREDRADVNEWLPWLNGQLAGARFLAEWELVQAGDPPRSWMGADALPRPRPPADSDRRRAAAGAGPGEFLLFLAPGRPVALFPFFALLLCPGCAAAERLFLYDSQKQYTTASKKVAMIESAGGHKEAFPEPAEGLARRFADGLLLEHYRRYLRHFEVLEGKLAEFDFDSYRQRVGHFVGRQPLLDAIETFFKGRPVAPPGRPPVAADRGYFLLVAEPGLGKTAVLTHWIDRNDVCPVPIRFFWRRGRALTRLDFLRHVYHGLLRKHDIEDADPPRDEADYPRKLDSLLKLVGEKYLAGGECEVIVIDGLDEAGDEGARALAVAAIPRELPPHVYVLLSSRPVRELDALAGEAKCLRYELKADAEWNRDDVREYVGQQLLGLVVTGELPADVLPRVCEAADGNFLWAEQFCKGVRTGQLPPAAAADALPRMRGLDGLYQEFWLRVVQGMPAEGEARLWRVAGLLAVARTAVTAEQLCHWAGLEDGEFIVLRAVLQQYLDEVVLPNERDPSAPLVGFRLYHASFRDFLARQPGFVARQHHGRVVAASLAEGADAPAGRYLARHGLAHCREAGRPDAALVLAGGVAAGGSWDAIADLVESMHEERAADPALVEGVLGHLKGRPDYGARLACLLYNVWRMPTPIAAGTAAGAQNAKASSAHARALWVVDLIQRSIQFTGILAAADCLGRPVPESLAYDFRLLQRPTAGAWVALQRDYYFSCRQKGSGTAFPQMLQLFDPGKLRSRARRAFELSQLHENLLAIRNRLMHTAGAIGDLHGGGLDELMAQAGRYFEVMVALAGGQLLLFQGPSGAGHGRFRLFAGPRPRPGDAVERPCPPGARPGEVFFAFAGGKPVSLSPWLLAETGTDADVPLLLYQHADSGRWHYWHLGRNEAVRINLPGAGRDFQAACALAREAWPPRDRPLTADDFAPDTRASTAGVRPAGPAALTPFPAGPALLTRLGEKWRAASRRGDATEAFAIVRDCCKAYFLYRAAAALGLCVMHGRLSRPVRREVADGLRHAPLTPGLCLMLGRRPNASLRGASLPWLPAPESRELDECVMAINELNRGPMPSTAVYARTTQEVVDRLASVAAADPYLALPRLVEVDEDNERVGIDVTEPSRPARVELNGPPAPRGQLVLTWSGASWSPLAPILWCAPCPSCRERHVFFLAAAERLGRPQVEVEMTDLLTGHTLSTAGPVPALMALVGDKP